MVLSYTTQGPSGIIEAFADTFTFPDSSRVPTDMRKKTFCVAACRGSGKNIWVYIADSWDIMGCGDLRKLHNYPRALVLEKNWE
jgi:hypothetical protein